MNINRKEFVHRDIEFCKICKKEVLTKTQKWVAVIDYLGENHIKTGIYHRDCLDDLLKAKGKMIQDKFKKGVANTVRNLFGNINLPGKGNQEMLYELKQ
ncbi:hypothetical protein ES702_01258 [subsurface metagenome]